MKTLIVTGSNIDYFVCYLSDLKKVVGVSPDEWEEIGGMIIYNQFDRDNSECIIPKGSTFSIEKEEMNPWWITLSKGEKKAYIVYWVEDKKGNLVNPALIF